jgi:hypothetical protein
MRDRITAQLERQTGATLDQWNGRISGRKPATEQELRAWLTEQAVTGYPQMLLVQETFGYPDYLLADADELVEGQYADRPGLRPILEAVTVAAQSFGEVEIQARKTYVTLLTPRRTFASIEPSAKSRLFLGLRLEGQAAQGRLETGRGLGQSSMTHRVALATVGDVDGEVLGWLERAFAANS